MTVQTTANGQIVKRSEKKRDINTIIEGITPQLAKALPRHLTAERIARISLTALKENPQLAECDRSSLMGCLMQAAQLGLEPNSLMGQFYLIPRKTRRADGSRSMQCTAVLGYQGMIELAYRSGLVDNIYGHVVRDGDGFEYCLGLRPDLQHRRLAPSLARVTHAYAVAHLKNRGPIFVVLTREEIEARRNRGGRRRSHSAWDTDFEVMCVKTAIRALFTRMPKSSEIASAERVLHAEEAHKTFHLDVDTHEIKEIDELAGTVELVEDTSGTEDEDRAEAAAIAEEANAE